MSEDYNTTKNERYHVESWCLPLHMQLDASHSEFGQPEERSIGVCLMLCNTQEMIQS
jgi:hypothetical protein